MRRRIHRTTCRQLTPVLPVLPALRKATREPPRDDVEVERLAEKRTEPARPQALTDLASVD